LHQKISLIDRRSDDMIKQAASGRKDSKFDRVQLERNHDRGEAALPPGCAEAGSVTSQGITRIS
jgi:hypothetical protein